MSDRKKTYSFGADLGSPEGDRSVVNVIDAKDLPGSRVAVVDAARQQGKTEWVDQLNTAADKIWDRMEPRPDDVIAPEELKKLWDEAMREGGLKSTPFLPDPDEEPPQLWNLPPLDAFLKASGAEPTKKPDPKPAKEIEVQPVSRERKINFDD